MNTLLRHFADCALPVRFVSVDPRPRFRWSPIDTADEIENRFFADVVNRQKRDQFFRIFADDEAVLTLMDKQPEMRHLLLQVRTPTQNPKGSVRHILLGHDERQLFMVNRDGVSTVRDALASLKPAAVTRAEKRGLKVVRQGDWFFIPTPQDFPLNWNAPYYRDLPLGRTSQGWWGMRGHPHIAEEQYIIVNRNPAVPREDFRTVFVRGKVRHEEHATVEFTHWHRAIPNTVNPNIGFIGYWD